MYESNWKLTCILYATAQLWICMSDGQRCQFLDQSRQFCSSEMWIYPNSRQWLSWIPLHMHRPNWLKYCKWKRIVELRYTTAQSVIRMLRVVMGNIWENFDLGEIPLSYIKSPITLPLFKPTSIRVFLFCLSLHQSIHNFLDIPTESCKTPRHSTCTTDVWILTFF